MSIASTTLRALFAPSSVAVIGASRREGSIGRAILANLKAAEFAGRIHAVNPNATQIEDVPCAPNIGAIRDQVDLAVIAVPAELVEGAVLQCVQAGVRAGVIITSGFAEISQAGKRAQDRLVQIARAGGMRLVGPNCLGVIDTRSRLNASFSPSWPPTGSVAIASQSGALAIAMIDQARERDLGIASLVSIGNRADVSSNDLVEYWGDDPDVSVIALYLESFGNTQRFAEIAARVSKRKPITALKAGRSVVGMRAASSHSAALATSDVGVDALFASTGVIRVGTTEELFDVVQLLSAQPAPRGRRIGIVTNAGGPGILLADACAAHGLVVPTLADSTRADLRTLLSPAAAVDNPVDLTAGAPASHFARSIELVGNDPQIDALVSLYIPPFVTKPAEIARAVAVGSGNVPRERPVAAVFMVPGHAPHELATGSRGRIPSYTFPENIAVALAHAARYDAWRARPASSYISFTADQTRDVRDAISMRPDGWLSPDDVTRLLQLVGITVAPSRVVAPTVDDVLAAADDVGYPIVIKAVATGLLHKSDVGGVATNLRSREDIPAALTRMLDSVGRSGHRVERVLVQHQVSSGVEMLVGMNRDATLGPVVVSGTGGTLVELVHDVACRLPPISTADARAMVDELHAATLLAGYRGSPPADRAALELVIQRIGALAGLVPEFAELELNPMFVLAKGNGVVVVDARGRIERVH